MKCLRAKNWDLFGPADRLFMFQVLLETLVSQDGASIFELSTFITIPWSASKLHTADQQPKSTYSWFRDFICWTLTHCVFSWASGWRFRVSDQSATWRPGRRSRRFEPGASQSIARFGTLWMSIFFWEIHRGCGHVEKYRTQQLQAFHLMFCIRWTCSKFWNILCKIVWKTFFHVDMFAARVMEMMQRWNGAGVDHGWNHRWPKVMAMRNPRVFYGSIIYGRFPKSHFFSMKKAMFF